MNVSVDVIGCCTAWHLGNGDKFGNGSSMNVRGLFDVV